MTATIIAYAKINLFLHIIGKHSNGLHLLESVVAFTSIADIIKISIGDKLSVNFTDIEIDKKDNTVYKAVELLSNYSGKPAKFSITVKKGIPIESGMGGGSADAAAILKYLCELWKIDITQDIYDLALQIGSDVPACLYNKTAFVRGVGGDIKPVHNLPPLIAVLVNPGTHINTKQMFGCFFSEFSESYKHTDDSNILETIINARNDMQKTIEFLFPEIAELISIIKMQDGCLVSRMSGTGSTCFGLFLDRTSAKKALISLKNKHQFVELSILR